MTEFIYKCLKYKNVFCFGLIEYFVYPVCNSCINTNKNIIIFRLPWMFLQLMLKQPPLKKYTTLVLGLLREIIALFFVQSHCRRRRISDVAVGGSKR